MCTQRKHPAKEPSQKCRPTLPAQRLPRNVRKYEGTSGERVGRLARARCVKNIFVPGALQIESDCASTAAIGRLPTPIASRSIESRSMPSVGEGGDACGYGGRLRGAVGLCSVRLGARPPSSRNKTVGMTMEVDRGRQGNIHWPQQLLPGPFVCLRYLAAAPLKSQVK
jgi:hypothetical protein